jgi:hypothetical protein
MPLRDCQCLVHVPERRMRIAGEQEPSANGTEIPELPPDVARLDRCLQGLRNHCACLAAVALEERNHAQAPLARFIQPSCFSVVARARARCHVSRAAGTSRCVGPTDG